MKRIILAIFILLLPFVCFSQMSTADKLSMKKLYSITDETQDDIRGKINISRLLIYKDVKIMAAMNELVTIENLSQGDINYHVIRVYFVGPNWRFLEGIVLKIDDEIIDLKDENPERFTNRSSNVSVTEIVSIILSQEIKDKLLKCKTLVIQYYGKPITIPAKGITAIKQFLK